jgi:hypothetical protein
VAAFSPSCPFGGPRSVVAAFSPSCPFGGPRSVVAVCPVLAAATAARPSKRTLERQANIWRATLRRGRLLTVLPIWRATLRRGRLLTVLPIWRATLRRGRLLTVLPIWRATLRRGRVPGASGRHRSASLHLVGPVWRLSNPSRYHRTAVLLQFVQSQAAQIGKSLLLAA